MNISPHIGFKVTDNLSMGIGADAQRLINYFDMTIGMPVFINNRTHYDSLSKNKLYSWGYGWHAGLLYEFSPQTRFGMGYHSQIVHHAKGTSTIEGPLADFWQGETALRTSNNLQTTITLPAFTVISLYHDINAKWAVMATANYTQWSSIRNITLLNAAALDNALNPINNLTIVMPQNFRNTWRYTLGTQYQINPTWLIRTGISYDQTPTNNADRNLFISDNNRILAGLGTHYQATRTVGIDLGWTHVFIIATY